MLPRLICTVAVNIIVVLFATDALLSSMCIKKATLCSDQNLKIVPEDHQLTCKKLLVGSMEEGVSDPSIEDFLEGRSKA